eukprot:symbB.v1.2.031945.t1/scaffold3766.1/size50672/7
MRSTRSGNDAEGGQQAPEAQPDLYSRFEEAYDWVSGGLNDLYTAAVNATTPAEPRTSPRRPQQGQRQGTNGATGTTPLPSGHGSSQSPRSSQSNEKKEKSTSAAAPPGAQSGEVEDTFNIDP